LGRLVLGPLFHQVFSAGSGSKSETGGPSAVTQIKQSDISTDRQDLQSDLIFPMGENPRSQQDVDRGKIKRISTNIRMLQNLPLRFLSPRHMGVDVGTSLAF